MSKLEDVIAAIDKANNEDPNREATDGREWPKEYLYSLRMSGELARFAPEASEPLQIAVRAQHIRRWQIPRASYPKTRRGYLQWRRELGRFHAEQTAALMEQADYDAQSIEQCRNLLMKKGIKQNPETQALEDVACLVFLRYYLEDFASKHEEDKLLAIIRKTWGKMSEQGHEAAMTIDFAPALKALVEKALSGQDSSPT